MRVLNIKNSDIPIKISFIDNLNKTFTLEIVNRSYDDCLIAHLYDKDNNLIAKNEKLIYGMPLFNYLYFDKNKNRNTIMPNLFLIPSTLSAEEELININNIGVNQFVSVVDL